MTSPRLIFLVVATMAVILAALYMAGRTFVRTSQSTDAADDLRERLVVARMDAAGRNVSSCVLPFPATPGMNRLSGVHALRDGSWILTTNSVRDGGRVAAFRACAADPAFGTAGIANHDFTIDDLGEDADGTIVALSNDGDAIRLRRLQRRPGLHALVSPDAVPVTPALSSAHVLRLQPDGKILIGGRAGADPMVLRTTRDGRLDPSFGARGVALRTGVASGYAQDVLDIATARDGRIAALAQHSPGLLLLGFLPNGTLDPVFECGGTVLTDLSEWGRIFPIENGYVAAGLVLDGDDWDLTIERYDLHGHMDLTYGRDGRARVRFHADYPVLQAAQTQRDGAIVLALTVGGHQAVEHPALVRLTPSGQLDATFGKNGVLLDPVLDLFEYVRMTATPDGGFLMVGRRIRP